MKRLIIAILLLVTGVIASGNDEYRSLLQGGDNGKVYISENVDVKYPLASITKMMTLMIVFDALEEEKISLNDKVDLSKEARSMGGSRIWIGRNTKVSVDDLIKATAIYSANNAAYGLAEHVAGSIDAFVVLMNDKARKLGLGDELEFHTPAGLPSDMTGRGMDVGSAKGVYGMSLEALNYPNYIDIASRKNEVIQGTQKIFNRNDLISKEKGIYGIKTGYHESAGYNISVVSKREGVRIITVLFGAKTSDDRKNIATEAVDQFYISHDDVKLVDKDKALGDIVILSSTVDKIEFYPLEDVVEYIDINSKVDIIVDIGEKIAAPAKKGKVVGGYIVRVDGEVVAGDKIRLTKKLELENEIEDTLQELIKK